MRSKNILIGFMGIVIVFLVVFTVYCGQNTGSSSIKPMGKIYDITFQNNTGKDITGLAIKASSSEEYSENKLVQGDIFAAEDQRRLVYDATKTEADANDEEKICYDIQLTFNDDTKLVLSDVAFSDMSECEICFEDDVAFINYVSLETKESISTKDNELKMKQEAEEKAKQEAEEKAKQEAEQKAAAEAAEKAAAQQKAAQTPAQTPTQAPAKAPAQSNNNSDGCIGNSDDLLY